MRTTIELPDESENALHNLARQFLFTDEQALDALIRICLVGSGPPAPGHEAWDKVPESYRVFISYVAERFSQVPVSPVESTPSVLGGDARIRNTRIPVWTIIAHKKWGESDEEILEQYPTLKPSDLAAAYAYYAANTERADEERWANEEAE